MVSVFAADSYKPPHRDLGKERKMMSSLALGNVVVSGREA